MGHPIPEQLTAAPWDNVVPPFGISLVFVMLERMDLVLNE